MIKGHPQGDDLYVIENPVLCHTMVLTEKEADVVIALLTTWLMDKDYAEKD